MSAKKTLSIERFKKFQRVVLGNKEKIEVGDIDIRNYAKYILREGSNIEKRELLACLKSKLVLKNRIVILNEMETTSK